MTAKRDRDAETGEEVEILADEGGAEPPAGQDGTEAARREYDALYDKYLRLVADFDNYKKIASREREQYLQFGNEEVLKDWLPVLDNIERALHHAREHRVAKAVIEGWALILKQCQDVLSRLGVTAVESVGCPFNPEWHQAIAQRESAGGGDGVVVEEAQRGYLLKGKLLRPALVTVSKGAPAPDGNGH